MLNTPIAAETDAAPSRVDAETPLTWPQPDGLQAGQALFLDFDGTLVDLAPRPQDVHVPPGLAELLLALQQRLDGALAIISGRPVAQIDAQLAPLHAAVAGEHGAVLRLADGAVQAAAVPDLTAVVAALQAFAARHPGLLVETKGHGVALHYRHAPDLADLCLAQVRTLSAQLAPLQAAVAGEHGAVLRLADGTVQAAAAPDLSAVVAALQVFAARHPGLLVEPKGHGVALHYRHAPDLADLCLAQVRTLSAQLADAEVLQGKAVVELKSAQVDKGRALRRLLAMAPFAGRQPVFLGDDTTDEAALAAAQAAGGWGIKVGAGVSVAQARLSSPAAVIDYLHASLERLHAR